MPASIFTAWTEYPSDPLTFPLDSANLIEDYFPCTIYDADSFSGHGDAVLYKMWCQGKDLSNVANIALCYSSDGINWTLQSEAVLTGVAVGVRPSHPFVLYDPNGFGGGPYYYKMWYWDLGRATVLTNTLTVQSAESVDGITWTTPVANTQDATQFLANTNSTGNTPFYQLDGFGTVIYNPDATSTPGQPFSFPYAVFFDMAAFHATSHYFEAVGLAYSSDGLHWFRYGTSPVLTPSTNTADWDGAYEYRASVLKLAGDGMYHMYYSGSNGVNSPNTLNYAHGIGHAMSADGINWTKDPSNPIFIITDGVAWRVNHVLAPSVVFAPINTCANQLQMWFSGGDTNSNKRMGYATLCIPPVVVSLDPNSGFTFGGNTVNITGDFFTGTTSVLFGSIPVTSFVVNSENSITVIAPPGVAGMVDVTVVATDETSAITPADIYTYTLAPTPLSPFNFTGVIKKKKSSNKTEYVLKAKWDTSLSANIVQYRIYKYGKMIKEISATSPLDFRRHVRRSSPKGYKITAVDSFNQESSPMRLRIVH